MFDISPILKDWDYVANDVTVRIIEGDDRKQKIQMRLDLGLLQMEYSGRPDGERPHGFESLLEYYKHQLQEHIEQRGSSEGFCLDSDDCTSLRNESLQYYYRYLSLFHLEEYEAVERDTIRNLNVFDFLREFAENEEDRYALEQYRPYVIMMNARATSHRMLKKNHIEEALATVEDAILRIKRFFKEYGRTEFADQCSEVIFLQEFINEIRKRWSANPVQDLRDKMKEAVSQEDYETAARIRDEIKKLISKQSQ